MTGVRTFTRRHAMLALLIVALAIGVRALVPTGYMTSASPAGLTVELCSGVAGKTITIALPGQPDRQDHGKAQADGACAFTSLAQAAGGAADPILLAIALLFILALGLRRAAPPLLGRSGQIRPPLRGPPLQA